MFLDNLLFIYDDFLDNIQPEMRKKLAVILLTIGALFMLSYSIIDDDFSRTLSIYRFYPPQSIDLKRVVCTSVISKEKHIF